MTSTSWQRYCQSGAVGLLILGLLSSCSPVPDALETEDTARTVTVLGRVKNEQQENLEAAFRPFEERTGIKVRYEGSLSFARVLAEQVEAGKPPDVAMFPQPTLIADYARREELIPLTNFLPEPSLQQAYSEDWLTLSQVDGEIYALWYRAIAKSLVWYRPSVFEENGYSVPKTWRELIDLSDQIVAEGKTPWCIGLESGEATGWVGTDWIEGILLRTAGPNAYQRWIDRELPFESPEVLRAFDEFGWFLKTPGYVEGGAIETITTPYSLSSLGLFDQPPDCFMHQQGSFISSFFPEEAIAQEDYDIFLLPEIEPEFGTPLIVSGDAFAMFNDTPEARLFLAYMATAEPHEIWAKQGGFISPHQEVDPSVYPSLIYQKIAQLVSDTDELYFDASDMMPPSLGLYPFWEGMIDFAAGKDAEDVARMLDSQRVEPSPNGR